MNTKFYRSLFGGMLVAVMALSLSTGVDAKENKDAYFGGTAKESLNPFAEIRIRGVLSELTSTTVPTTIGVTVGTKVYLVEVSSSTKIVRKYEGKSNLGEMVAGDTVTVWGSLLDSGNIKARKIKDESIFLVGYRGLPGTIKSINLDAKSFVVTRDGKDTTVVTDSKMRVIIPGVNNAATLADLQVGDKIGGRGVFNTTNSTVTAKVIILFKRGDTVYVKQRLVNVEGKIFKIESTTLPTSIKVTNGNKTYLVNIATTTMLVRNNFVVSDLTEFKVGDKVRVIGSRDPSITTLTTTVTTTINAKIVRNRSLKTTHDKKIDSDEDGIPDMRDGKLGDHDNDGITNATDPDDDNDGILDRIEKGVTRYDHDNDGVKDNKDKDDDNDGIADTSEATGKQFDHDNDGTPDATDTDDDNDGKSDVSELSKQFDHDNDGKRDDRDSDDDNDDVKDGDEESGKQFDKDNDGVSDKDDDED